MIWIATLITERSGREIGIACATESTAETAERDRHKLKLHRLHTLAQNGSEVEAAAEWTVRGVANEAAVIAIGMSKLATREAETATQI